MAILEVTKRRLNTGINQTDPTLLSAFPEIHSTIKTDYLFYAAIEDPAALLILSIWPFPIRIQHFHHKFPSLINLRASQCPKHPNLDRTYVHALSHPNHPANYSPHNDNI